MTGTITLPGTSLLLDPHLLHACRAWRNSAICLSSAANKENLPLSHLNVKEQIFKK